MRNRVQFFRSCICWLLLVTTPVSFLDASSHHSKHHHSKHHSKSIVQEKGADDLHLWTYDEIIRLLDEVESLKVEKKCSREECAKIDRFLVLLAKEGESSDNSSLDRDIAELVPEKQISDANSHALRVNFGDVTSSTIASMSKNLTSYFALKTFPFKSYHKSNWKKTKKFIRKHRQAIIIGVTVVVAVVVVVTVVVMTGSTSNDAEINEEPHSESMPEPISTNPPLVLKEIIQEHLDPIKDLANESVDPSFSDKARALGSILTHETLHGIAELASVLPELQQELVDLSEKLLPQGVAFEESKHPKEDFDKLIAQGHEKIDQIFSTDQAEYFTSGERDRQNDYWQTGIIPPPGKLLQVASKELKSMAEAGEVMDRGGFTKAGRSLMKHGYRDGSVFPKPVGNVKQINEHGQKVLEEILCDSNKAVYELEKGGMKVYNSNGKGVEFRQDGSFKGFIEEQYEK